MSTLSVIIIAGNESSVIKDCLLSCQFADEIIIYANSTDDTLDIAKDLIPGVKTINNPQTTQNFNFSEARNQAFKHANSEWILYLDADERITLKLQKEISNTISNNNNPITNYDIPRANYFLGKRVRFGGSYPDYVKRLFLKKSFQGYQGVIHEQPQVTGLSSVLKNDLIHLTHRSLTSMLNKSIKWTHVEAELLLKANHPPVVWWRFYRMLLTKFWQRYIQQQMWRDGLVGLISVIFEMYDTYMIYAVLYELQLNHA
jgi:glycosyltransferase involved in cell wall biosynthesis